MMNITNFLTIEADASPTWYGATFETIFKEKSRISGLIAVGQDTYWLTDTYEIKSFRQSDNGLRTYVLQEVTK